MQNPYLGPGMDDIHEEGLERLHILVNIHLQLALTLHLCNASGGFLQLPEWLRQVPLQLHLLLQKTTHNQSAMLVMAELLQRFTVCNAFIECFLACSEILAISAAVLDIFPAVSLVG